MQYVCRSRKRALKCSWHVRSCPSASVCGLAWRKGAVATNSPEHSRAQNCRIMPCLVSRPSTPAWPLAALCQRSFALMLPHTERLRPLHDRYAEPFVQVDSTPAMLPVYKPADTNKPGINEAHAKRSAICHGMLCALCLRARPGPINRRRACIAPCLAVFHTKGFPTTFGRLSVYRHFAISVVATAKSVAVDINLSEQAPQRRNQKHVA